MPDQLNQIFFVKLLEKNIRGIFILFSTFLMQNILEFTCIYFNIIIDFFFFFSLQKLFYVFVYEIFEY